MFLEAILDITQLINGLFSYFFISNLLAEKASSMASFNAYISYFDNNL